MRWIRLAIGIPLVLAGPALLFAGGAMAWSLVIEPWIRPGDPSLTTMVSAWGFAVTSESAEAVMISSGELLVGLVLLATGGLLVFGRPPVPVSAPPVHAPQASAISRISDRLARASDRLRTVSDRLARASDRLRPASDA